MIPQLKKIKTDDIDLRFLQDAVNETLNMIVRREILDGKLIKNIALTTGTPKTVDHGLGRVVQGWIAVRKSANANIWDTKTQLEERFLVLNSSANVNIDLWVF
jgi:hypothetical protein